VIQKWAPGRGAVEVTARILAEQPDPIVMLRYRRKGNESFSTVPMSRKEGDLFSAFLPTSQDAGSDEVYEYKVSVEDGGRALAIAAATL
jgi:hypothetical protein